MNEKDPKSPKERLQNHQLGGTLFKISFRRLVKRTPIFPVMISFVVANYTDAQSERESNSLIGVNVLEVQQIL